LLLNVTPAFARVTMLDEVVVTASRYPVQDMEVAQNVTVIDRETIDRSQANNVGEILRQQSNFNAYDYAGNGSFIELDARGLVGGQYTKVLVDGIPVNSDDNNVADWNVIPADGIERIEILRGPGASLYGGSAVAATINIITRKAENEGVDGSWLSQFNHHSQEHKMSVLAREGILDATIFASRLVDVGWRDNSAARRTNARGNINIAINDISNIGVGFSAMGSERESPSGISRWQREYEGIYFSRTDLLNTADKRERIWVTYDRELPLSTTGEWVFFHDHEGFHSYSQGWPAMRESESSINGRGFRNQYTSEFNLGVMPNTLMWGAEGSEFKTEAATWNATAELMRQDQTADNSTRHRALAFFAEDRIGLGSLPVYLYGGGRWDRHNYRYHDNREPANNTHTDFRRFTPRGGIVWNYLPTGKVFFNYAKIFKVPTGDDMFYWPAFGSNPLLTPEEGKSYEAGIQHSFLDGTFEPYVTAYHTVLKGRIVWTDLGGFVWEARNSGKSWNRGIETGFVWLAPYGFTVSANYSYCYARERAGDFGAIYFPEWVAKQSAGWSINYDNVIAEDCPYTIGLDGRYRGQSYLLNDPALPSANTMTGSPYTVWDVRGEVGIPLLREWIDISLFAKVSNLFNHEYDEEGAYSVNDNVVYYWPGRVRTFTGGVTLKF